MLKLIGQFAGRNYIRYECEPGYHLFWARSENRDFVEADLLADKIYFLEMIPQMGAFVAGVSLQPVNFSKPGWVKRLNKLMTKKPPLPVYEINYEEWSPVDTDFVERGLKTFANEKAKGYQHLKLLPDQYYTGKIYETKASE